MIKVNSLDRKISATKLSLNYLYGLTLVMIILSSTFYYRSGYFGGDLEGIKYKVDTTQLFIFTSIYVLGLFGACKLSLTLSRFNITKYVLVTKNKELLYSFFFIFSLVVLLFAFLGGVGTIQRNVETNRYAELFFAFFDPYIFILLCIYYIFLDFNKRNYSKIILVYLIFVYLLLIIRSGFTGFLIPLLPILIDFLLRFLSKRKVIFVLIFSILSFPFIRMAKWFLAAGWDGFSSMKIDGDLIQIAARGVVERFSAVPNMIFINESLENREVFLQTSYLPFFQGYLGSLFHKVLFSSPVALNTLLLHHTIQNSDTDSNSTFPIISYFSLDFVMGVLAVCYVLILVFLFSRLLSLIFGQNHLGKMLVSFFLFFITFFYAFNGWLWGVWGAMQALVVFAFILLLNGKLSNKAHGDCKL